MYYALFAIYYIPYTIYYVLYTRKNSKKNHIQYTKPIIVNLTKP